MKSVRLIAATSVVAAGLWSPMLAAQAAPSGDACSAGLSVSQASVGDYVWYDGEGDGLQDGALDSPLAGIVLILTGPDGGPVTDVNGALIGPATTDASGYYEFVGLPVLESGLVYTVTVDASTVPAGMVPTKAGATDRAGDSSTGSATSAEMASNGTCDTTLDFGFKNGSTVDPSQPVIRTMVSTTTASAGVKIRDKVWVSGLLPTDRVTVNWKLYGPAKPVKNSCAKVKWAGKPVKASGSFTMVGEGTKVTRKVKLSKVGCYTFGDTIAQTTTTLSAIHKPGNPAQTVRVFPKKVLSINTGGAGYL